MISFAAVAQFAPALLGGMYWKGGTRAGALAGLGIGGEGYVSFSIAGPTGEGITTPLTFTRERRCSMIDDLRILGK